MIISKAIAFVFVFSARQSAAYVCSTTSIDQLFMLSQRDIRFEFQQSVFLDFISPPDSRRQPSSPHRVFPLVVMVESKQALFEF